MPYPETRLLRHRHRQIFLDDPQTVELDPIDGWLAGFVARLGDIIRSIGGKKK